jgi:hypothetical protein
MTFFVVKGRGTFPLDMLRYDEAFPRTEKDSWLMEAANTREVRNWEISLCTNARHAPTIDRWSSFVVVVTEIDGKSTQVGG